MNGEVLDALIEQQAELESILAALPADTWLSAVPRCPGWTIADVVLHVAQTDELAVASANGELGTPVLETRRAGDVDEGADLAVERERGAAPSDLLERWRQASTAMRDALACAEPTTRLPWITNTLTPKTVMTTRLAESWIHTGDIADALGIPTPATARLEHIAWLAWRTLPYAFERAGQQLSGPIAVALTGPDGQDWSFGDIDAAATTVIGPAEQWCAVAARRVDPSQTQLEATGPDADAVLALVRTYA